MKKIIAVLISISLLTGCKKEQNNPQESSNKIYAIAEIGIVGRWKICKLDEDSWDFKLFGDTINFGGFADGASTTFNHKLIVNNGQSIKQIDLDNGKLIKEVSVGKIMFGLESEENESYVYSAVGSSFNNIFFSKVNIETGEIITLSDIQLESVLAKSPSTTIANSSSYYLLCKNDGKKIYCFDLSNGSIKNEIPITDNFPLHKIDGLEYNKKDGLIYYIENKEDGKWKLMTLNPDNNQIEIFLDDISLNDNINTMLLDIKKQKYLIQNSSSSETIISVIDLSTKQITTHINTKQIIELNQVN